MIPNSDNTDIYFHASHLGFVVELAEIFDPTDIAGSGGESASAELSTLLRLSESE